MISSRAKNGLIRIIDYIGKHKYVAYSFLFFIMLVLMHARHVYWGTGLIWAVDGVEQQYPFFIAEGRWLREVIQNLFSGQLLVPQWTMDTGYGAEYMGVLLNTIGNPFNLLSIFSTSATAEFVLTVSVILQLYFSGIAFLRYCTYRRFDAFSSVLGAVVYVFSGYTVLIFKQLFMLYPLVLAPIVLQGIDRVFDKRSPILFIVSQALCALYSVTMVYAVDLLLVVYCIVRYILLDEPKSALGFVKWFFKILGFIALGLLVAGILIAPSVVMLMGQSRLALERPANFFYSFSYYFGLLSGLLYPESVGVDCYYGYAPIGVFGIFALFVTREKGDKQSATMIVMLITMVFIIMLPMLGRLFNGFAYPNNRWIWAMSLLIGLIVAYILPKIEHIDAPKCRLLVIVSLLFGMMETFLLFNSFSLYFCVSLALFFLLLLSYIVLTKNHSMHLWRFAAFVSVPLWCASVFLFWTWMPSEDMEWNETYEVMESESPVQLLEAIDWDDGYCFHYDGVGYDARRNACLALGIPGSSFYNSLYNSLIDKYHDALGLTSSDFNFSYHNFGGRTALEALAGVKYYLAADEIKYREVPSLYSDVISRQSIDDVDYSLIEASSSLPIAFRYDQSISEDSFYDLSMVQRQEALLQGVVVEESGVDARTLDYSMLETPAWFGDLPPEDGQIEIEDVNVPIIIHVFIPAGKTAYLELVDFEGVDWANASSDFVVLTLESGDASGGVWQRYPSSSLYSGKNDWTINLRKSDYDRSEIAIYLSSPGAYRYSSLNIVLEDDVKAAEKVSTLSLGNCENVLFSGNSIVGDVDMGSKEGFIFFRVPYSQGWTATVDGLPVAIERANVAFMAVWMEKGLHEVQLQYSTPGLSVGIIMTVLGLIGTALVELFRRSRQNSPRGNNETGSLC